MKQYMLTRKQCYTAIFLPFIYFPYIAFSNHKNINKSFDNSFIDSADDIDKIEQQLIISNKALYDNEDREYSESLISDSSNEELVFNNETVINDEPLFDELVYDNELDSVDNNNNEDSILFTELDDNIIDDLSLDKLDSLEENIVSDAMIDKKLITEIIEYQDTAPSDEAIAFGGNKKVENFDAVQTKNDTLKCSRCGSSLIGAESICPGCGAQIKNT